MNFSDEEIAFNLSVWNDEPLIGMVDPGIELDTTQVPFQRGYWELISRQYVTEEYDNVAHITKTQWYQSLPYNTYCPLDSNGNHYSAGCGPVAIGQVLYHLYLTTGSPSQVRPGLSMSSLKRGYESSPSLEQVDSMKNVAQLFSIIGELTNSHYTSLGTWTSPFNINNAFTEYGFDASLSLSFSENIVKNSLTGGNPVLVFAMNADNSLDFASTHYFLIDGYKRYRQKLVETYNYVYNDDLPHEYQEFRFDYTYYSPYITQVKMNWGWSSQWSSHINDGWYSLTTDWITDDVSYSPYYLYYNFRATEQ